MKLGKIKDVAIHNRKSKKLVKGQHPYLICPAKRQNHIYGSTRLRAPENVRYDQIFFFCKTSNIGTIGNIGTAEGLPTIR